MPSYDPETKREQDRRKYERIKADPEKHAAYIARISETRRQRRAAGIKPKPRTKRPIEEGREYDRVYKLRPEVKRKRRNYERERMDRLATRPRPDVCENCGTVGKRGVVFDHDHTTGEFRGWLCDNCNRALGLLNDDLERILGLASYLETHRCGPRGHASAYGKEVMEHGRTG